MTELFRVRGDIGFKLDTGYRFDHPNGKTYVIYEYRGAMCCELLQSGWMGWYPSAAEAVTQKIIEVQDSAKRRVDELLALMPTEEPL